MPGVHFKVGCSLDANIGSVFVPLEKAAEKARARIHASLAGAIPTAAYRSSAKRIEDAFEQSGRGTKRAARITGQSIADIKKQFEGLAKTAKKDLDLSHVAAAAESELRKIERQSARTRLAFAGGGGLRFGGGGAIGIGRRAGLRVPRGVAAAYGYGGSLVSGAIGVGKEILGGLGVDTDMSSLVGKAQAQQTLATQISNSAYLPGTELVRPGTILSDARAIGNATGTDTGQTLEALQAFVSKTGDLQSGRDTLESMAKLARATGTNLVDMANAAAEVSNNLGDLPDKGKAIADVMRVVAGQGKLGAVEIRDLASQMAKIASQAGMFEGGRSGNIAILGAMAQETKLRGGAASAQQATTSVQAFVSALSTKATLRHWEGVGLNPYTNASKTTLRSPEELILEALKSSNGNKEKLAQLFPSKQAMRAVQGFQDVFTQAGGGQKGLEAVDQEFKRLASAAMAESEVQRAFAESMKTSEAQVTIFNNHMSELAEQLSGAVLPSFEKIAPVVVSFTSSMANLLGNITGANRDEANKKLDDVPTGTAEKDIKNVRDTSNVIHGPGGDTKVYDKKSLDVLLHHGAARGQGMAELEGQVKVEEDQAAAAKSASGGIQGGFGLADWIRAAVGVETKADEAERLVAQARKDRGRLEEMHNEQRKTNDTLHDIYQAIKEGHAIIKNPGNTPPPAPTPGSTMPPNTPPPG